MTMKLFLWHSVERATDSYHDEGGIVVIESGLDAAGERIRRTCPSDCEALRVEPDLVADTNARPRCFVFPDAGCC